MKKLILPIILSILFILVSPAIIYAGTDEASPAAKSSSGYDPKCWNTHMNDEIAVCNKALLSCMKPCPGQDLKANAICLETCSKVHTACLKSASAAYKVCIENERQAKKQQETQLESKATQAPSKKPEIQNKSSKSTPFNIFTLNPLETWRNIQELLNIPGGLNSLVQTTEILSGPIEIEVQIPESEFSLDPEGKPWDFLPGYVPHESIYLGNTMRISEGTKVSVGGLNQGNNKKLLNLEEGEVEVIRNELNITDSEYDGIKTQNATVLSIQTHYWVSYDKKKNQTTVAVYEGKVEVKTKDGQTIMVSSDEDKPGVVVVAQKLSLTKLAVTGLVLVVIFGGAVFFLRRKFFQKVISKNRK